MVRAQAGDQGEVVGEGQYRVGRIHPLGMHAFACKAVKVWRVALAQVVGAQPVDGNQQQGRAFFWRGLVRRGGAGGQ